MRVCIGFVGILMYIQVKYISNRPVFDTRDGRGRGILNISVLY